MTEENNLNIKKRAVGLAATVGLMGGLFVTGAPAAHAVQIGAAQGSSSSGRSSRRSRPVVLRSPLLPQPRQRRPASWCGVRASARQLTTTGAGTCQIGAGLFTDVTVGAKLSGVASCDSASVDPSLYPLNGKLKLSYAAKTLSTQAYVRIAGFDPFPDLTSLPSPASSSRVAALVRH